MMFFLLGLAAGWAQSQPSMMALEISVDDQEQGRLSAPAVEIVGESARWQMLDDGTIPGDVAEDGVWVVALDIAQTERLVFRVWDSDGLQGEFTHPLPMADRARYAYRTQPGQPPLVELAATGTDTLPPAEGDRSPPQQEAVPTGEVGDSIDIVLVVDDRALGRLVEPVLQVDQVDIPKMAIRDDGTVPGDIAGDGIWMVQLQVRRTQFLMINLLDQGGQVGQIKAFLPSSDEAEIRLMTTSEQPGLEQISEATSSGGVGGPEGTVGAAGGRLAHVLWVMIALFAVLFTYLRTVVWRTWKTDILPRLDLSDDSESGEA